MHLSQSQGPRQDAGLPWPQRLWLIRVSGSDVRKIRTHSSASRHNRNRSHVPGLDDNVHGTVGAVFLAHHAALVLGPGKAKVLFEGGYAHPGPSLLGKRQGQYGVCRADSTVARTLWQTGPTPRIKGRGKGACSACMQRPQRRQHARTSGSGSEPGARTGMVKGLAKSAPYTRPRQVPAARDRQKVLRKGQGELPALLLRSPACGAYRRAPYSQACTGKADQTLASLCTIAGHARSLKACRAG